MSAYDELPGMWEEADLSGGWADTEQDAADKPENFPPLFKAIAAMLGIETTPVTDAFGRTDFAIDREGMKKLRAAAIEHGFDDLAAGIDGMLSA